MRTTRSGSLIACVPALWILDGGYLYLLILQVLAGATWAAFELAMLLAFFESIPKHQRLGLLTIFNVGSAAAIALGAVAGGALLSLFESGRGGYHLLFTLSTAARLAPLALLVRMPHLKLRTWFTATRSIAVRPSMGTIERPVLASLSRAAEASPVEADAAYTNGSRDKAIQQGANGYKGHPRGCVRHAIGNVHGTLVNHRATAVDHVGDVTFAFFSRGNDKRLG